MEGMAPPFPGQPTRTRNRWGEGERLRAEILDATSRLLSELGDEEGLTLRGVARATGVAPASIYPHFPDRDSLMSGLLARECERLCTLLEATGARAGAEPVERLRAQLYAYCEFGVANPGHYRILFRRRGEHEETLGPLRDIIGCFTTTFDRCTEAGHRLRLPSQRAAVVTFTAVHGRVALFHANPTERNASLLRPYVDELVSLTLD
jgi:AcrR family transcriptional regulator